MADQLQVELVAADRIVWSGSASSVLARTVEGEIGVLRGHTPLLSLLADATVEVTAGGQKLVAAVDGGFISVANDRVSVLAERALMSDQIDVEATRAELQEARSGDADDPDTARRIRRAEVRLQAVEDAS